MIGRGARAPTLALSPVDGGAEVIDPWNDGPCLLVFFKVTCPTCQMSAPKVSALAESGCRVVAVGQDPRLVLAEYGRRWDQAVPTVSEAPPYPVSDAYGVEAVPTLVLVGDDGVVLDAVAGWDRQRWNDLSVAAGGGPVSSVDDGLPSYRPG